MSTCNHRPFILVLCRVNRKTFVITTVPQTFQYATGALLSCLFGRSGGEEAGDCMAWPAPGFMTPVFAPVLYISSSADCALRWIFPMPVYLYNLDFLHLIFHSNNLFLQLLLTFSLVLNTLRDSPACYSWFKITGSYSISIYTDIYHFLVTLYNIHEI